MQSDGVKCEREAADVIGRYAYPLDHAAVLDVVGMSAIETIERLASVLPQPLMQAGCQDNGAEGY